MTPNLYDRETLQGIRDTAREEAVNSYLNSHWQAAFRELARAADHLDAMQARAEAEVQEAETGGGAQ